MKTLRWGLIGCGDIARKRIAPALRDSSHSELVAVSRSRAELAEAFAIEFGARKWYSTWQELLRDEEIDAVYVATPVHLHAAQTVAAARAGKQVLCEKPMALDSRQCDEMIAACRANGVQLGIAYYRHFYPVVDRVKSAIESGEIGQAIVAQINAFEWFNPEAGHPRSWLIRKDLSGGGPMFDFGCHRIEVLLNIFGRIKKATGLVTNTLFDRAVEDTAIASFQFDHGATAVLTVTHAARDAQDTLDVFGSRGSIHIPILNDGRMCINTEAGERWEQHPPEANFHAPLIDDFVEAVAANREPAVSGEIGRMVAQVEEAIYADQNVGRFN